MNLARVVLIVAAVFVFALATASIPLGGVPLVPLGLALFAAGSLPPSI
jgi:hypothetical protein